MRASKPRSKRKRENSAKLGRRSLLSTRVAKSLTHNMEGEAAESYGSWWDLLKKKGMSLTRELGKG